jgi:CheY-like chemotaxis protein
MEAKAKILVVDDDPDLVAAMRLLLEGHGYRVVSASSGVEGLRRLREESPDLLLLDVMMEDLSAGFHVAQAIRDDSPDSPYAEYREVPIIMLTAVQEHTRIPFKQAVGSEYLPVEVFLEKPFNSARLAEVVEDTLLVAGQSTCAGGRPQCRE